MIHLQAKNSLFYFYFFNSGIQASFPAPQLILGTNLTTHLRVPIKGRAKLYMNWPRTEGKKKRHSLDLKQKDFQNNIKPGTKK